MSAHRLTGLFVGIAVAHGAIVGPTFHRSTVLRVSFLSIGGLGIAAYVYRELFARFVVPVYEYEVAEVRHVNDSTLVVGLDPVRSSLAFVAGQFVFVEIGGSAGWQRHPFTVSSAPAARRLELSIKATGDYTRDLQDSLRPGLPAKVTGPFGGFDYRSGTDEQIWIAGGIGITPFISWIRALDGTFAKDVDFYYSVKQRDDAVYANEVIAAAARHPSLRVHLVITDTDGVLTADAVMSARSGRDSSVYRCGPTAMTDSLSKGFRRLGVRPNRIRWEQFAGR